MEADNELTALLESAQEHARAARRDAEAVGARMPTQDEVLTGKDRRGLARVEVVGFSRITALEFDEAQLHETDDDESETGAAPTAAEVGQAVVEAFEAAVNSFFTDPSSRRTSSPTTVADGTFADVPSDVGEQGFGHIIPGAWPSAEDYEVLEQRRARANQLVAEAHSSLRREPRTGRDASGRVEVTGAGDGRLTAVSINEGWLDGVSAAMLARAVSEALNNMYEQLDASRVSAAKTRG